MHVRVILFAKFKDLAGADHIVVPLSAKATLGDLRKKLMQLFATATGLVERSALAVNNELANDDYAIPENAEVALLPPVSGG
jgi:molybdopterin converting factor small subunit